MGSNNVGEDLALVGAWLTVMADLFAAVGATVLAEPSQDENATGQSQKQVDDMMTQLKEQKKMLQKQQIQFQLMQMQMELRELELQVKDRKK